MILRLLMQKAQPPVAPAWHCRAEALISPLLILHLSRQRFMLKPQVAVAISSPPWPACRTEAMIKSGKLPNLTVVDTQKNFKKAIEKGVLKILSKMGISLLSCYHGAQIFEIYGLGPEVVDLAFRGSVSRIGGMTLDDLQREVESQWVKVRRSCVRAAPAGGLDCRCSICKVDS